MVTINPNDAILGATVEGLDLSQPLAPGDFRAVLGALGQYGVLRIPNQSIGAPELKKFAAAFGTLEINVANNFQEPGHPEVMILSNMKRDGKPIGLSDAGQDWHTDMSYSADRVRQRAVWHHDSAPRRLTVGRHRVRQHVRRL